MDKKIFTGFTDKNGKKIYTGDILSWKNDDGEIIFNKVYEKNNKFYAETGIGEDMLLEEILPLDVEVCNKE